MFESSEVGQVTIEAPTALLLFPGIWHRYKPDFSVGWEEDWISVNGEYLYRLSKRGIISANKPVLTKLLRKRHH